MIRRLAWIALAIGIVVGGSLPASGAIITKLADYTTAGVPIVNDSSDTRSQEVLSSDFPSGDLVSDVDITIDLTKSGGTIASNGEPVGGGLTYNRDIGLALTSPVGTTVLLVVPYTFSGQTGSIRRTLTFDDSADDLVGGAVIPQDRTFRPIGLLSDFNGQSPTGEWSLFFEDISALAPFSVNAWTLSVETSPVPEPSALAIWLAFAALGLIIGCCRRWK